jgi:hypothetical protein
VIFARLGAFKSREPKQRPHPWSEVLAGEPRFVLGCFVGYVASHDDMDIEPFRDLGIDLLEELQEIDRPVTVVAFAVITPRRHRVRQTA